MHQHSNYRGPKGRREKEGDWENIEEIIVENFPNMGKEIVNQVQKGQRVPYRINPRRNTPRYILIKLSKIKKKEKKKAGLVGNKTKQPKHETCHKTIKP